MGNPSPGGSSEASLPTDLRIFSPKLKSNAKRPEGSPDPFERSINSPTSKSGTLLSVKNLDERDKNLPTGAQSRVRAPRIPLKKKLEEYLRRQTSAPSLSPEIPQSNLPEINPPNSSKVDDRPKSLENASNKEVNSSVPLKQVSSPSLPEPNFSSIPLGSQVITLKEKKTGILRYVGRIKLKEGIWAGVELDEKGLGKNDGSVGGERYFTCQPNSGIFIDPRAIRIRKPAAQGLAGSVSGENLPASKIPVLSSKSIRRNPVETRPKSMVITNPLQKQVLNASNSSLRPTNSLKIPKNSTGRVKRDHPALPGIVSQKPSSSPHLTNLSPEPRHKFETEVLDESSLNYLASENANPAIIIQNLLSQLHSSKKQNELLQIRVNKKRAQNEATRMIRSELLERARKDALVSPKTAAGFDDAGLSLELKKKEKAIEELNRRLTQKDLEIQELKLKLVDGKGGLSEETHSEGLAELSLQRGEVQNLLFELRNLQKQLLTQEEIILLIKDDVYSEENESSLPARVKQAFSELVALKENSSRDIVELELQISNLARNEKGLETSSFEPSQEDKETERLKLCLEKEALNKKDIEELQQEIIRKHEKEIALSKERIDQLSIENCRLREQSTENSSIAERAQNHSPSLPPKLEKSDSELRKLKEENVSLQKELDSIKLQEIENETLPITQEDYEDLREEKNQYLLIVEELQGERVELLARIDALRDSGHNSEATGRQGKGAQVLDLEERIRALEDELVASKAFAEKVHSGTLTQEDVRTNMAQELQLRNHDILQLETKARDYEEKVMQLSEEKGQLLADMQSLENDNWELNDLVKELQDELTIVSEQAQGHKAKVTQLEQILESLASSSDSAFKLHEIILQCEENENNYRADTATLYKMIDEQDEELAQMAEREAEMQDRIAHLERQLEMNSADMYQLPDEQTSQDLNFGGESFCRLCFDVGHEEDSCPNPISPTEIDEATLARMEASAAELDSELSFAGHRLL